MKLVKVNDIKKLIPRRSRLDNKSTHGKTLIIAGSESMPGAAILSARACSRSGSGYTYIICDRANKKILKYPDLILLKYSNLKKEVSKFSSFAVGPGMVSENRIKNILKLFVKHNISNVVVDASALKVIAKLKIKLPKDWILTPHEGELAVLLNKKSDWVRFNRIQAVQDAYKKYGCCILLKGHTTLIYNGSIIYAVKQGRPSLAKAGTGDVLTGIIAAFLSQKLNPLEAAKAGSFVHGMASQVWFKKHKDDISLNASDLIELLPDVFFKLRKK